VLFMLAIRPKFPAAVCAYLLTVLIAPPIASPEDWPRWRGGDGDGNWSAPKIVEKWPAGGPPVVWEAPIGPGYSGI
jgi:hypothetical protein